MPGQSVNTKRAEEIHPASKPGLANPVVFAFASGKGGVGKTSIVANLGVSLAKSGKRVCIFDADTNLANINIMLRLRPEFTIEHLLKGEKHLDEIMIDGPERIRIIPAASGIADLVALSTAQRSQILDALRQIENRFDYLLIDCAAGINQTVLTFLMSAPYIVLVITTEPTSLTDAYSLLKVLRERGLNRPVHTVINRVASRSEAISLYRRFKTTAEKYLHVGVHTMGYVLSDRRMDESVHQQTANVIRYPNSPAARCISALAKVIDGRSSGLSRAERFSDLWNDLAESMPEPVPKDSAHADAKGAAFEDETFLRLLDQIKKFIDNDSPADHNDFSAAVADLQVYCEDRFRASPPSSPEPLENTTRKNHPGKDRSGTVAVDRNNAGQTHKETSDHAGLIHSIALAGMLGRIENRQH